MSQEYKFETLCLHAGQEPIARTFATKAPVADKWDGVAWSERDGIPASRVAIERRPYTWRHARAVSSWSSSGVIRAGWNTTCWPS